MMQAASRLGHGEQNTEEHKDRAAVSKTPNNGEPRAVLGHFGRQRPPVRITKIITVMTKRRVLPVSSEAMSPPQPALCYPCLTRLTCGVGECLGREARISDPEPPEPASHLGRHRDRSTYISKSHPRRLSH